MGQIWRRQRPPSSPLIVERLHLLKSTVIYLNLIISSSAMEMSSSIPNVMLINDHIQIIHDHGYEHTVTASRMRDEVHIDVTDLGSHPHFKLSVE